MAEQHNQQHTLETYNDFGGIQDPVVNLTLLPTPIGIMSAEDGVIVFANESFRNIIKATRVGEPIHGFLDTHESRTKVSKKISKHARYTKTINKSEGSLRFTITQGDYLGSLHYFVCIEKTTDIGKGNKQTYLDRENFLKQLLAIVTQSKTSEHHCLCSVDIDRFSVVNEKYGFEAGDFILNEIVEVIQKNTPDNIIVGRLGGNEFGLILKNTKLDDAVQTSEVIREVVKDIGFKWKEETISLTISIGVIALKHDQKDLENTLAAANLAIRSAQENGRAQGCR